MSAPCADWGEVWTAAAAGAGRCGARGADRDDAAAAAVESLLRSHCDGTLPSGALAAVAGWRAARAARVAARRRPTAAGCGGEDIATPDATMLAAAREGESIDEVAAAEMWAHCREAVERYHGADGDDGAARVRRHRARAAILRLLADFA